VAPALAATPPAASTRPPASTEVPPTQAPAPAIASGATEPPTTILLFTGDINPGRCVAKAMLASGDFNWPYEVLASDLQAADILVGSLDGSLTDRAAPDECPDAMNLNGPARVADGLRFAGFDVITVATNHAKNCGLAGCWNKALLDTLDNLSAAGIQPVGGGRNLAEARRPVVVERNGTRFAFLGVSDIGVDMLATATEPGTNPLKRADIVADIQAARQIADVVIVLPQWGGEYTHTPNWQQFNWAGLMMAAGATLVIGNQAHWVQAVETFPHGVVAYALGNFVFDQTWSTPTQQAVLFEATFRGAKLTGWRLRPIHISADFQPHWADPAEAAQILADIDQAGREPPVSTRHK
jgi:poly-gamma-glutamate capsule biosynthesis protein CapA/YwtB (metallophosphatase superfamily)